MDGAEMRAAREWLGVTRAALAQHLGVTLQAVKDWEGDRYSVSASAAGEVERLTRYTVGEIQRYTQWARAAGAGAVLLVTSSDAAMTPLPPAPLGAAWWRMVAQQVRLAVPEVAISYHPDREVTLATTWTPPE